MKNITNYIQEAIISKTSIDESIVKGHISKKCKYLCFTAKQSNSSISFTSKTKDISIFYSKDGDKFESWDGSEIKLDNNELIYVYGDNSSVSCNSRGLLNFSMTGKIAASGNIMSLISLECPTTIPFDDAFAYMFIGCTALTSAPSLPATTLSNECYLGMFYSCTSLTNAPDLPATTLTEVCYSAMFSGCTKLKVAPLLPATTLTYGCYSHMFYGCVSLINAPELPATLLSDSCYNSMLNGCTNLNHIKAMFTTTPSNNYTYNWVKGVASSGTFIKNVNAKWDVTGNNAIPEGWNVKTEK